MTDKPKRKCGSCTACCWALGVEDTKTPCVTCQHQIDTPNISGCAIYEDRPEPCRVYACAWLQGFGERADRPDRLGVILEGHGLPDGPPKLAYVLARELKDGNADKGRASRAIAHVAKTRPVFILKPTTAPTSVPRTVVAAPKDRQFALSLLGKLGKVNDAGI